MIQELLGPTINKSNLAFGFMRNISQNDSGEQFGPWASCLLAELKAQVSYSDNVLSVVHFSIRLSVFKLLHFRLFLQNYKANFKQSWHKSSLGRVNFVCSNEGERPSRTEDYRERVKIH
jgi:hypothetical protein